MHKIEKNVHSCRPPTPSTVHSDVMRSIRFAKLGFGDAVIMEEAIAAYCVRNETARYSYFMMSTPAHGFLYRDRELKARGNMVGGMFNSLRLWWNLNDSYSR